MTHLKKFMKDWGEFRKTGNLPVKTNRHRIQSAGENYFSTRYVEVRSANNPTSKATHYESVLVAVQRKDIWHSTKAH